MSDTYFEAWVFSRLNQDGEVTITAYSKETNEEVTSRTFEIFLHKNDLSVADQIIEFLRDCENSDLIVTM